MAKKTTAATKPAPEAQPAVKTAAVLHTCRLRCDGLSKHEEKTILGHRIVHTAHFVRNDNHHHDTIELSFETEGMFAVGREYTLDLLDQ